MSHNLKPLSEVLQNVSKVFIYALIHPLIERDVKYVGMTINPENILSRLKHRTPVSRWCLFLQRQNTEPEIVILSEVDIRGNPNAWREVRQYWIDRFKAGGCQLFNRQPKMPLLSKAQKWEISRQCGFRPPPWTEERKQKQRELSLRIAAIRRVKGKKRRALVNDLMKIIKWERFSEHLVEMSTQREKLIDDLMELVLSDKVIEE